MHIHYAGPLIIMMTGDLYSEETVKEIQSHGRRAAGWFCSYTPVELLDAAGFTPVRISGTHESVGVGDTLMHTNICPFVKSCVEAADAGKLDFIDLFVFTNGCDAQRRMHDVWKSLRPEKPVFLTAAPKQAEAWNIARLASEFAGLKAWLEEISGVAITDECLAESVEMYKELRARLGGLYSLRRDGGPALSGARVLEILLAAQRMPAARAVEMLGRIAEEPDGEAPKGPTVLLAGNMVDDPALVRRIERFGVRVAADEHCAGQRFVDVPAPATGLPALESLAASYLTKPPCPRMSCDPDFVDELRRRVEGIRPDGVIIYMLKFCDTHLYNVPRLRDMFREMDVKTLFIEGDYTSGSDQLDNRIQAFVEMLK